MTENPQMLPRRGFAVSGPLFAVMAGLLFAGPAVADEPIQPPRLLIDGWRIELVASEPDLVTPVACCFDAGGRLYVIESHTHKRQDNYAGPSEDRIAVFDDGDGDGTLDRQRTFHSGGHSTMGLVALPDGWLGVVCRHEVYRLRDTDGDLVADERETLATLKTETIYPHNGLVGGTLGPDGSLHFGLGENFGEPYELVAADGSRQIGSGEGGSVFAMTADGHDLRRIATGFWNPFAMLIDNADRLWVVGNDPDAMPPCRLIHVVPTGDYGFQFRFGRAGTHPLQSWGGRLPATLPYAAATGEAPSGMAVAGDQIYVTSWGDNRIERYRLSPKGASFESRVEVVAQGGANFRPVGIAVSPNGDLYVTDWVRRDYSVHGQGRLWRLIPPDAERTAAMALPDQTEAEAEVARVREAGNSETILDAATSDDPFIRQAAVERIATLDGLAEASWSQAATEREAVAILAAMRWHELSDSQPWTSEDRLPWIRRGLGSPHPAAQLHAVRWATERDEKSLLPDIRVLISQPGITPDLFAAAVASVSYLQNGTERSGKSDPARDRLLWRIVTSVDLDETVRASALRWIPTDSKTITDEQWLSLLDPSADTPMQRELVRVLGLRKSAAAREAIESLADNGKSAPKLRRDAMAFLKERDTVGRSAVVNDGAAKPPADDIDAWAALVGQGGDARNGYRVFVRSNCIACHAHSGRGANTGPSLSNLSGQTRRRIMTSILLPSQEIGPLYVPQKILTDEGKVLVGIRMMSGGVGKRLRYQASDGSHFEVATDEIEFQQQSDQSIMPAGLERTMTIDEFRDLLALLEASE